jgi:hypothetical protein
VPLKDRGWTLDNKKNRRVKSTIRCIEEIAQKILRDLCFWKQRCASKILRFDCGRGIFLSKPYRTGTTKSKLRQLLNEELIYLTSGAAAVFLWLIVL